MFSCGILVLSVLSSAWGELAFPPGFRWGAATAAYQVEGAWNVSDKTPSIWDTFTHKYPERIEDGSSGDVACDSYRLWERDIEMAKELGLDYYRYPERIEDGSSGDVACDSYRLWERDIEMAKELGLDYYRFSISWPRLVPNGFADKVSEDGKNYYNMLIDGLLANGIEPVVTLYHWDLPQRLQDYGGWLNPLISDWFADYARVAFSLFGDRVTTWLTINEALVVCTYGYGMGVLAPGISENDYGKYVCIKNIVMAHGKAYRVYEKEFKAKYPYGKISLANHFVWYEGDATAADDAAAELMRQQSYGLYCHPIFSTEGGWPQSVAKVIAENSKREGYPFSRLPEFTQEEIELVRGTYDYLGLNHYTSRTVIQHASADTLPANIAFTGSTEFNVSFSGREEWGAGSSFWFRINPPGLRSVMRWIKQEYGNVDILITENGYSDKPNTINDDARVDYYRGYLEQVLLSIKEDGVNVTGYTAWTLMDNFEWIEGYTSTFGLYQVDFSQADRPRTPRKSARYYASIVKANSLDVPQPKDEL